MDKKYIYENKDESDICILCGSDSAYYVFETEDDDDGKYYCSNCNCEYMYTGTEYRDAGELLILKGEKRDWFKHLNENLTLPFEGVVSEFQERGYIKQGDRVIVNKLEYEDDLYGVIAYIELVNKKQSLIRKKRFSFPLADIDAKDEQSANYKLLDDYSVWFANCRD